MKCAYRLLLLTIFFLLGNLFNFAHTTCVLESDFGITLNCAFKKSGLFRIRNLGGLKASIGLGLSLGDELGFKESISNTEINRRRSTQVSKMQAQLIQASQKKKDEDEADKLSNNDGKVSVSRAMTSLTETSSNTKVFPKIIGEDRRFSTTAKEIPPFKPIPPAPERPIPNKPSGFRPVDPSKVKVMAVFAVPKHQENHDNNNNILDRNGQNMDEVESLRFPDFPHNFTQNSKDFANILQQQQILNLIKVSTPSTTVTTTNRRPVVTKIIKPSGSIGKVMNAPKEYYPVGYDKNFDDNFAARVELPETSFHCGNQKHFPGLYADEDLGCMVFHVCALTEDGLIMKSFLCPESTLYDQTILKCNWWFYVDCKNSKNLYDSNIPISKSYQLMKALTFFSAYKKETPELKKINKSSSNVEKS